MTDNETDSFYELNAIIDSADEINLTKNYCADETPIELNRSVAINGQNHTIDCDNKRGVVRVDDDLNLVFKNTTFKNIDPYIFDIDPDHTLNIALIDCKIISNNIPFDDIIYDECGNHGISLSGNISDTVIGLAKSIVGKSTDIAAAKKLARWVKDNIEHETKAGFYQSPDTTLLRGIGNCCCHTDLFLQMCVAIGLDKTHTLGYVHVGSSKFHHRHFFAIIDNVFVDTDCGYNNPWGHASIGNKTIHCITIYPTLPLTRKY